MRFLIQSISMFLLLGSTTYAKITLLSALHFQYLHRVQHPILEMVKQEPLLLNEEDGETSLSILSRSTVGTPRQVDHVSIENQFYLINELKSCCDDLSTELGMTPFIPRRRKYSINDVSVQRVAKFYLGVIDRMIHGTFRHCR